MNHHSAFREVESRRADFPSLSRLFNGLPIAYLDGPGGTQVPRQVIDAVVGYYATRNSNTHGMFVTAQETDRMITETREAVAAFVGAAHADTISFGANMTTLAFSLSRALSRSFRPGDEVLITQLDHEANRGPWLALREHGIVVREVRIRQDASLDYDHFASLLSDRTRLVAMGWASNAFGTVNDVTRARELTYACGAMLLVDAVHFAPHFPLDVASAGVDFCLCSAYKFYGPHVGILYAREGLLEQLQTDRLRTQDPRAPFRIETGTLNHAALAGVRAAIDYLAILGKGGTIRERLVNAMESLGAHERALGMRLFTGLSALEGVTVHGQTFDVPRRAPTVSFTMRGRCAAEVAASLADSAICTWDGHFYAIRPMEVLGLLEAGGVIRAGVSLYTTVDEIDRLLLAVDQLSARTS